MLLSSHCLTKPIQITVALILLLCCDAVIAKANQAVITLGMSNALSGPTAQLGIEIKQGSLAYFHRVNKQGGVNGKMIKVISVDDSYEPVNTVRNTRDFIRNKAVFALFGYVGTPTSFAIMPLLKQSNIPYLMPFTGAEFLRKPVQKNIFNVRASYYQEAEQQIDYLVNKMQVSRIGLLIQADEFGLAVEQGLVKALQKHKMQPIVTTRYKRNTQDIDYALETLKRYQVDAVAFVGTYQPFSEFINTAATQNFKPIYTTVSFVSSSNLFARLKQRSQVLVTEVMPDPNNCISDICLQFRQDMAVAFPELNQKLTRVQFEGYINALTFVSAAQKCQKLTRACLIEKLENLRLNLPDLPIKFSPNNHQGLNKVYFSFY